MGDELTPEQVLQQAMDLLQGQYDADKDTFFVVVTHRGKGDEDPGTLQQTVLGELSDGTVLAFVLRVVQYLCHHNGQHPSAFIAQNILEPFVERDERPVEEAAGKRAPCAVVTVHDTGVLH